MTRKSRERQEVDIMKPITIELFGSEDDPCFGKHHDPAVKECKSCGDQELCAIVQAQRMHKVRDTEVKKYPVKDLEEPNMDLKSIEQFVLTNLKKGPRSFEELWKEGYKFFSKYEKVNKDKAKEMFLNYCKRSVKLKRIMKNGKKFLKLA